jgi:glycosyltransferase involved in cell wall biosynthesis
MHRGSSVSVVLPTYNEKDSIRSVIRDFESLDIVDEILVVNNNAVAGTSEEVAATSASEVFEAVQGYGSAIRRGLREARGDLLVVCEPDGTFAPGDLHKLLAYVGDVDIVYGSRTVANFIWKGANMGRFLKWGNWATAKLLEMLFNTNSLSDIGCTFRVARRQAIEKMEPHFAVRSNFFGPEMMILGYRLGLRSVQIPLNYRERVGRSSVTGDLKRALKLGLQMIVLIVGMRLGFHHRLVRLLEL